MTSLANGSSSILMVLRLSPVLPFLMIGLLLMFNDDKLIEGVVLTSDSFVWLFFVIRSYIEQHTNLESLR